MVKLSVVIKEYLKCRLSIPYKVSKDVMRLHNSKIKNAIHNRLLRHFSVDVSVDAVIGRGLYLPHPQGIVIGDGAIIGNAVRIYQGVTIGQNRGKFPRIGDNVVIYAGAKIFGGIAIGDNAIIGANAVVIRNVEKNAIVAGVPATVVGERKTNDEFY